MIWPEPVATAISAMVESGFAGTMEITVVYPALIAIFTASRVSVKVPI